MAGLANRFIPQLLEITSFYLVPINTRWMIYKSRLDTLSNWHARDIGENVLENILENIQRMFKGKCSRETVRRRPFKKIFRWENSTETIQENVHLGLFTAHMRVA